MTHSSRATEPVDPLAEAVRGRSFFILLAVINFAVAAAVWVWAEYVVSWYGWVPFAQGILCLIAVGRYAWKVHTLRRQQVPQTGDSR